jgi:hypothetical protein
MKGAGYSKEDLLAILSPMNYQIYRIYRGRPQRINSLKDVVFGNFIFSGEDLN